MQKRKNAVDCGEKAAPASLPVPAEDEPIAFSRGELWYNGRIAGIILRINGFCVYRRNPALFSVGDSMFL